MTIEQRMELLERTIRLWRRLACTMAVLVVATVGIGAVQMNEDELVLRKLVIQDEKGRDRIALAADKHGGLGADLPVSGEVAAHLPLIDEIVEPDQAPDVGVKVQLGDPVEVMLAPEGDERWGFFMFPSIWQLRDGRLVCAVTIGGDHMPAEMDYHYLWYISDDEGQHWTHAVIDLAEAKALLRERFTLASGRQIYYEPKLISLDLIDPKPYPVDSIAEYGFFKPVFLR